MFEDFGGCKGYVYQNNVSTYVNMPLDGCVVRTLFTTTFSLSGGVLGTWEGWHDFWATHMDVHEVCQRFVKSNFQEPSMIQHSYEHLPIYRFIDDS